MALNKFYGIEELLDPGIYTQRIKVKVSRKWKDSPPQTQSLGGISVFLTDNSNTRIYCWIPSNLAEFYDIIGILGKKASLDIFINKHGEEEVYLDFEIMDNMETPNNNIRHLSDMEMTYLHDLHLHQDSNLNIQVAVTRKWTETDSAERVQGINLIVVDKYDNRLHCWIPSELVNTFIDKFVEGCHYVINNFSVEQFNQKDRCFEAEIHIVLHSETAITEMPTSYSQIPKDIFCFKNLKTILESTQAHDYLIDLVGIVEDLKPMEPVNGPAFEKHFYIEFVLTDLIDRVRVRLWDRCALQFQKQVNDNRGKPSIITISSCKIIKNQYNGETTIRTVKATRTFLNYQTEREVVLRKRCVRFDKHIFFSHYTKMEQCASTTLTIPNPVVDLFSLKDLQTMEEDKRFLCDVCGVLKDPQDFRDYMNDSDEAKQQKKFTLTDGSTDVGVTLFDDLAKMFEEAIKNITTGNIVVILSSAKIGKFQGDVNLTNYPATRFYINADHPAVKRLQTRSKDKTFLVEKEVTLTQLEKVVIEDMSIAAIKKMNKEAKVNCKVTVKKIEEHLNWFFYICIKCNLELELIDGRYKCSGCSRFFPWPQKRFRVFALCCDKTGVLPLMLADREIRRLTGKMVFDVELDLTEEPGGNFPLILKNMLNKEYNLTLSINQDNISKMSEVYEVCDILMDAQDNVGNIKHMEQMSEEAEDDQNLQDMDAETEGSHNVSKQQKNSAKTDRQKNDNAGVISSQKSSFNREKAIKIKKEKNPIKEKKTVRAREQSKLAPKKKGRKLIEVISESEDEDMTLNSYQLKNKKQNFRMHAFVPGKVFEEQETKLKDGNICIISNFTIKEYDSSEKFRCVNHDKQIILTNFTQIEKVDLEDGLIQRNMFDFYDLIQLENIADQNLYLTDVVGIIERDTPIGDLVNRFGKKQKQVKFNIVDGRYAQGKFSKYNFVNHVKQKDETLTLADVKKLPINYAEKEIICKVKIKKVLETGVWFRYHCTSCYKIIEMKNGTLKCYRCSDRNVPEPDLRWEIHVQAEDKTGEIDILLLDREIRTIFNLAVIDFDEEVIQNTKVPQIIKALENQHFAVKLEIKDSNILKQLGTYYATGIYACPTNDTIAEEELLTPQSTFPTTVTQDSGPSYHIEDFSDPNIKSPEVDKRPKRKKKLTKKYCE
ncbi:hypothetical protein DCAR_0831926 [Daucus carota subsp. sativus]|uniref:Uncharacterized protein n=1 Tax=Daucus carota subsp. sativus TaxID=79200 RepID=A0A175YP19_DAUCS|nr:hypothetical protein DCAR_0831926 [Daucus carota subsp. sativus]